MCHIKTCTKFCFNVAFIVLFMVMDTTFKIFYDTNIALPSMGSYNFDFFFTFYLLMILNI